LFWWSKIEGKTKTKLHGKNFRVFLREIKEAVEEEEEEGSEK
jgi:hypothetical protein